MAPTNFLTIFKILSKDDIKISGPLIVLLFGCQIIMNIKFSCPCITGWNQAVAFFIYFVPAVFVFLIMFLFLLYKVENTKTQAQDNPGTFQSKETELNWSSACFCLVPSLVWLCIYFIDGDYIACGLTYWNGHYACENELHPNCINWCKPTQFRPGTNETELYEETRTFINGSKVTGYILAAVLCSIGIVVTFYSIKRHEQEFQTEVSKKNGKQQDPTNPTVSRELQDPTDSTEKKKSPETKPRTQQAQNNDSNDMTDSEDPEEKHPLYQDSRV